MIGLKCDNEFSYLASFWVELDKINEKLSVDFVCYHPGLKINIVTVFIYLSAI